MINKNRLFVFLRFFLGFFLIAFIISRVNYDKLVELLPAIKLHFILIGLIWLLLDRVIMAYRWVILLKAKGVKIPLLSIVKVYFLSSFWGTFLPSSFAPDVIRVYAVSKYNASTSDVLSSVVVDRVIGTFSLSLVVLISLVAIFSSQTIDINPNIFWAALAILFLIVLLTFSDRLPWKRFQGYLPLQKGNILWGFLAKFYNSCKEYKSNKMVLVSILSISFIQHVLNVFVIYMIFLSLDLQIDMLYLFIYVPLVVFITMVPVSIGSLGVQEGAFVYFFSKAGTSIQEALTIAIIFRVLMTISSLPGGVIYASEGFQTRRISV